MDGPSRQDQEGARVTGFEAPSSPVSSYNCPFPGPEDEDREPPLLPPHLQHTPLNFTTSQDGSGNLPIPQNVILNHVYIQNREGPSPVVALGMTYRHRSKYVTTVIYKPIQR